MNIYNLEAEIINILHSVSKKTNSLSVNSDISNEIRQILINSKGKKLENKEFKKLFSKKISNSWARVYFKMSSDQLLKKVKKDYQHYFSYKLRHAELLAIACIIEEETENKFTAAIITGKNVDDEDDDNDYDDNYADKDIDDDDYDDNYADRDIDDFEADKRRNINDFNRSKFFLEYFNKYRQSLGLKKLELNPTLIEPAKDLSRQITKDSVDVDIQPFIDQANQIPGVKNVRACASFDSKANNYAKRMFEKMAEKFRDVVESNNDKISIGYWNSVKNDVSVACFLFS